MNTNQDFNYVKYLYGMFYAESLNKSELILETWKYYKNLGIINWLRKNQYIYNVRFEQVDSKHKKIIFSFNTHKTMYDRYLKAIENNIGLEFKPMGERVIETKKDDMHYEPVEVDDNLKAFKDAQKRILIRKAVA